MGVDFDLSVCSKKCEGRVITSYIKKENDAGIDEFAEKMLEEYTNFKKHVPFPSSIKGLCDIIFHV